MTPLASNHFSLRGRGSTVIRLTARTVVLLTCASYALFGGRAIAQSNVLMANLLQPNGRFKARPFHVFAIFDSAVESSKNDESLLNNLFIQFNKEFLDDMRKANKSLIFDNFQVVPTDFLKPEMNRTPRVACIILDQAKELAPQVLKDTVKRMGKSVQPGDIVFSYINCHGTSESGADYLLVGGGKILRSDIRDLLLFPDAMGNQQTHLTVFVTDNCRIEDKGDRTNPPLNTPAIWKSLYFAHQGVVDLTSTTAGAPAVTVGNSLFLRAFANTFDKNRYPKENDPEARAIPTNEAQRILRLTDGVVPWRGEFERILRLSMADVVQDNRSIIEGKKIDPITLVPEFKTYPSLNDRDR